MKIELPQGFTTRAPTLDDAQIVAALVVACDLDEFGQPGFAVADVLTMWRRKNLNLETDAWLILDAAGAPVGYMDVYDKGDLVQLNNNSCVHPALKNRGIEEWILQNAEDWARSRVTQREIDLRHVVNANAPAKMERMTRWGYQAVRNAWIMEIRLDAPPPAPVIPHGIVLRAFQRARDERAAWACIQEAFRDLWEHQDVPYEEWSAFVIQHGAWSPELSYLAWDGDELAGATITLNDELGGWVQQVAVRRLWRGRGIGLALLHQVFGELYKLGVPRAGLEVDAENPSGALRLYQRAGMHAQQHWTEFRKRLE